MIYLDKKSVLANLRDAIEKGDSTVTLKQWDARALYAVLKEHEGELIGIEPEGPVEKRRAPRKDKGTSKKAGGADVFAGEEGGREAPREGQTETRSFGQVLDEIGVPKEVQRQMAEASKSEALHDAISTPFTAGQLLHSGDDRI